MKGSMLLNPILCTDYAASPLVIIALATRDTFKAQRLSDTDTDSCAPPAGPTDHSARRTFRSEVNPSV